MFVVTHKDCSFKLPYNYFFFYVGAICSSSSLKDYSLKDNFMKNNISGKNPNYCELTALYAIANDYGFVDENVGLSHYRRFFYNPWLSYFKPKILSVKKLDGLLKKFDIVIPYCDMLGESVFDFYSAKHCQSDLIETRKIIEEKFPDYIEIFDSYFSGNKTAHFNMFYCSWKLINNYSNWLFEILFELENRINLDDRDLYQKRVFGFLSERLFNVWILKNRLKIKYVFVCNVEDSLLRCNLRSFKKMLLSKSCKF